jgi:hypothetical protein
MADDIDITPGTGKTVKTDDCGGKHVQIVKLAYGADGDGTSLGADANGLDVDVTRLPGTVTEDAASTGGESLLLLAAVRNDAAAAKTSTDGDYTAISTDSAGRVGISDLGGSITVDGTVTANLAAGTNNIGDVDVLTLPAPLGAPGATSIAKAEDTASADADVGIPAMAVRKATPANTSGTDGDYEMLQMSGGRLWTSSTIDAALPAGANAIGKLAANSGVDIGDVDVTSVPTDPFGANADAASATGSISAKLRFMASTGIPVTSLPSISDAQTIADNAGFTDGTSKVFMSGFIFDEVAGTALTENDAAAARVDAKRAVVVALEDATTRGQRASVDSSGRVATIPAGGIAHDGVDSGNPVKVGARAVSSLASATMVAAADRTDNVSDLDGAQLTRVGFPLGDLVSEVVTNTNGTSTAFSNFGATASTRSYITAIVVYNSSATAGTIDFRDGTAGSVLFTVPIPAGGGCVLPAGAVPYFRTSANTALAFDVSGALTTVTISVSGFKSKV